MNFLELFYELNRELYDDLLLDRLAGQRGDRDRDLALSRYHEEVRRDFRAALVEESQRRAADEWREGNEMLTLLSANVERMARDVRGGVVEFEELRSALRDYPEVIQEISEKIKTANHERNQV